MNKAFSLMNKLAKKEHILNPAQDIVLIKLNAAVYNLRKSYKQGMVTNVSLSRT